MTRFPGSVNFTVADFYAPWKGEVISLSALSNNEDDRAAIRDVATVDTERENGTIKRSNQEPNVEM